MKTILHFTTTALILCGSHAWSQTGSYTNFIRQVQNPGTPNETASIMPCDTAGQEDSKDTVGEGGARFELHTLPSGGDTLKSIILDSCFVGASIPVATVTIRTEDLTGTAPRTRADRPFWVDYSATFPSAPDAPAASKSVNLLHHVQSYGVGGNGANIDHNAAILLEPSPVVVDTSVNTTTDTTTNTTTRKETLTYDKFNSIPGSDRSKVRGEERFSIFTVADKQVSPGGQEYTVEPMQIASQTVQIWPVADGTISGIAENQMIRFALPAVTLALNDLYPHSTTYAQVYKGKEKLGTPGKVVPGSSLTINDSTPQSRVLSLTNYDAVFDSNGQWTMELLTVTPFGIDRLAYVTFDLDRTIKMNGSFTTIESK